MNKRRGHWIKLAFAGLSALAATAASAREPGVWVKRGGFSQVNVACSQVWACGPREDVLHGSDTVIAATPPKLTWGVCSAGGGAVDSCNVCLVNPPAEPCEWQLRRR